jgi:hypothetical protein
MEPATQNAAAAPAEHEEKAQPSCREAPWLEGKALAAQGPVSSCPALSSVV